MKNIDLPADGACQAGSREGKISSLQSSLAELWPSKVLVSCTPVRVVFEAVVQKTTFAAGLRH